MLGLVAASLTGCATHSHAYAIQPLYSAAYPDLREEVPGRSAGAEGWMPTDEDIARMERAIAHVMWFPPRPDPGGIFIESNQGHSLKDYVVRYVGLIIDGKRTIHGRGYPKEPKGVDSSYLDPLTPDLVTLVPFGGGDSYFSATYDVETERLVRFSFFPPY